MKTTPSITNFGRFASLLSPPLSTNGRTKSAMKISVIRVSAIGRPPFASKAAIFRIWYIQRKYQSGCGTTVCEAATENCGGSVYGKRADITRRAAEKRAASSRR